MKNRLVCSAVLIVCLGAAALPAVAQAVQYDNGAINGTTDGWTINFGFVTSDSFSCCREDGPSGPGTIDGLAFGAWLFPGDVLQTAEVQITSAEFGGTTFTDQIVSFTQSGCSGNQYGFNVCTETGSLTSVNLAAGTYWLNLDNAVVNDGDPVYWDENSGPSSASENTVGTIPSESFTLFGPANGSVPEPSSLLLLGSGAAAVLGLLRRRLTR